MTKAKNDRADKVEAWYAAQMLWLGAGFAIAIVVGAGLSIWFAFNH